ncbi:MAG: hypothetical protein ACRCT1_05140, partial [Microcoleaceae cyanobacterium]
KKNAIVLFGLLAAIASCSPHQKKRDRLVWALGGDRVLFTSSKKARSSWAAWARSRSTYH